LEYQRTKALKAPKKPAKLSRTKGVFEKGYKPRWSRDEDVEVKWSSEGVYM